MNTYPCWDQSWLMLVNGATDNQQTTLYSCNGKSYFRIVNKIPFWMSFGFSSKWFVCGGLEGDWSIYLIVRCLFLFPLFFVRFDKTAFQCCLTRLPLDKMAAILADDIFKCIHQPYDFYSNVCSDADRRKHQIFASLAFVRGIHRGPVNSPHKWPVTRKLPAFDDVTMQTLNP